eukprot:s965_g9.t2
MGELELVTRLDKDLGLAVPMAIISPHNAEVAKARQWKRWESAFQRLQNQGEVHKELLMQAIELAGFTIHRQEWLDEVVADITTYTTLDCDEFMRFLQNYEAKQYDVFITVFRHFDVDGNGHLESDELAALLENCGITALDQVLKEILVEVAPVDSSHLTLDEFRRVIEIIHVNEGFSSREIMKLKEVFRRFDLDRGGFLDTGELHKAMAWLGFAISPEEVADISNSCDIGGKGQLEEHEFFAFMRKVKEREITLVKKALAKQRRNAGGNVYMQKQLDRVLRTLGYIPNAQAIRDAAEDAGVIRVNPAEAVELHHGTQPIKSSTARRQSFQSMGSRRTSVFTMATVGSSRRASAASSRRDSAHSSHGTNEMGLDDIPKTITLSSFFGFLEVYRQREGLARCQIMELEAALKKYDKTGYGEIDTKDVGKVLRWMGYASGFNVQLMLVSEVDVDESGTLDAVELRKLVRKFQEKELTAWTTAFHNALPHGEKYLEVEACVRTLRGVGIKATKEQVETTREAIASSFSAKQRRFSSIMQAPHMADLAKLRNNILLKPGTAPQTAENSSSSSFAADASESSEEESENEEDANGNIDLAVFHLICSKLVAELLRQQLTRSVASGEQFLDVNGRKLYVIVRGDVTKGPPVICLPGAMGTAETDFAQQLEGFAPSMGVVAFDPRGYGKSRPPGRRYPADFYHLEAGRKAGSKDAQDAAGIMDTLGINSYHVMGWSDGAISATILAANRPAAVKKLAVFGIQGFITKEDGLRDVEKAWSKRMLDTHRPVYGDDLQPMWSSFCDAMKMMYEAGGDMCQKEAKLVKCPTFILHGAKDPLAKQSIRENAGYTWEEVQHMREKFRQFDTDGSGDIDNHEMAKLVQDLCPDLATNIAKRAEITRILSEVDPDKSGHVDFPDFLRLMRQVDEMQDRLRMAKETFAIEKSKFSSREVEEFRKLFLGEEDSLGCFRGMLRVDEFLTLLAPVVGLGRSNEAELTQLFFTIDAHMKPEFAEKVVAPASPKGQSYGAIDINNPRIAVDFPEFLILMSLLLEKNLCQVKERSSILAQRSSGRKTLKKAPSRLH